MYRRPKFLEVLLKIREEMAREADYDVDFFTEMVRNGMAPATDVRYIVGESKPETENGAGRSTSKRASRKRAQATSKR